MIRLAKIVIEVYCSFNKEGIVYCLTTYVKQQQWANIEDKLDLDVGPIKRC